jgi:hypothetical protein
LRLPRPFAKIGNAIGYGADSAIAQRDFLQRAIFEQVDGISSSVQTERLRNQLASLAKLRYGTIAKIQAEW